MRDSSIGLFAFDDSLGFARQMARAKRVSVSRIRVHRFPDAETIVRADSPAPRRAVVVRSLDNPNPKLIEVLLAADALRRSGAGQVSLVAPYLPYMRQDRVFKPGEPVSQRVVGAMLGRAFDAVFTLEPHLHRIGSLREVFPCRAVALSAAPAIAAWIGKSAGESLVAGPDEESAPWVRAVARRCGARWTVGTKVRRGDLDVRVCFDRMPAGLPGVRRAVLIDDIASSGATLAAATRALRAHGIAAVDAVVVHAIFAGGSLSAIRRAGARRVVSCDTIAHPTNAIKCAPLFAAALGDR